MASQSGISISEELKDFLGSCRDGKIRLIKVSITSSSEPSLELESSLETMDSSNWESDWDRMVPGQLDPDQPCYLLFRLDEQDESGYLWTFLSWSPDHAPTRQKMLYASTKATFKKEFGAGQIKDEYYANTSEEVTLAGYKKHLEVESAPGPLSRAEEEMQEIKQAESRVEVSVDTKHNTLSSLAFPFHQTALDALEDYQNKAVDYVQLAIDVSGETVIVKESGPCTVDNLPSKVPSDSARYHVFRFKHTHEGDYMESDVFIYTMPGYSVSIKERMMYSSCKNAVVEVLEKTFNIELEKKIEIENGSELSEKYLQEEIHPVKTLNKQMFAKPKMPSRGNRRITKTPVS
jgi:twinfilin-like protein